MGIRDRDDFIKNLKIAHIHLLILLEDIKYPLPADFEKYLEVSAQATGIILEHFLKEDIEAVLREVGKQQKKAKV